MEYYTDVSRRILLRLPDPYARIERWITHRHAWVRVNGHEDYISPFKFEGRKICEEEAEELKSVVPDMSEAFLDECEIKPGD